MRKILNIIALSTVVLMASCDLDKTPEGFLDPSEAYTDIARIEAMERGAYARLRDNYSIAAMVCPDIQADYVNAMIGYNNQYGEVYTWTVRTDIPEVENPWQMGYLTIAQCNSILDNTEKTDFRGNELKRLNLVRGHVFLMRAMSYSKLVDIYCGPYTDEATAKKVWGLPLMESHDPASKPGRAKLYDTYQLILNDLIKAKELLKDDVGAANAVYLNLDCANALEARVKLQMNLYSEAATAAQKVIDNPAYALAASAEEFDRMWTYDTGKEIIFKLAASKTELPLSYGASFYYDYFSGTNSVNYWQVPFIPTQTVVNKFNENPDDYRTKSWIFTETDANNASMTQDGRFINPGKTGYTMLKKFPGNPDLRTGIGWNNANTWKVFRLAEMYLIAAEANTYLPGGDAKTPLNTLRVNRGLAELDNVTLADVKAERYKELILEGFRLSDLRRWGDPLVRTPDDSQKADAIYKSGPNGLELDAENVELAIILANNLNIKSKIVSINEDGKIIFEDQVNGYRFVWPIPTSEIFANQNLANQQNSGWEK